MPIPEGTGSIPRVLTRERVLAVIRDWIVGGTLAPGEDLRDGELAEALGVSRTPVRVAMVELQREGLVERASNGRVSVSLISADDLARMIPVWVELEVLAACQAIEQLAVDNGEKLAAIERANAEFNVVADRALASEDVTDAQMLQEANERFHAAIIALAGNRYLTEPLSALRAHIRRYENIYFGTGAPELARLSGDDHDTIVSAIRSSDAATAETAVRHHIQRAWHLVDRLRADGN